MHELKIVYNQLFGRPSSCIFCLTETIIVYDDSNIQCKFLPFDSNESIIIAYVAPDESTFDSLMLAISIFNIVKAHFDIYCCADLMKKTQDYSNENIYYHDIKNSNIKIEANLIISFGSRVLYFLQKSIPVIILGNYGLGGWVTPETFLFLSQNGFCGRPGGILWEIIPIGIFLGELKAIKTCTDLDRIHTENAKLALLSNHIPLSKVVEIRQFFEKLHSQFFDKALRNSLIPIIASNIILIREEDIAYFKRLGINDTIATIAVEDTDFFNKIDGNKSFAELCSDLQMENSDFWEIMNDLYDKNIITIKHAIF